MRLVLKGLARDDPHCPKQACPITPEILLSFHQLLELNNAYDATIWCLFLTAFFLMIRKSNLVPNSAKTFQSQRQLIRENMEFDSKNNVLIFHINWSKTIQYGERKLKITVAAIPGSLLCPVRAYLNMIDLTSAPTYSPAFVFMKRKKLVPVPYPLFQSTIRNLINCIGKNPKQFSTHTVVLGEEERVWLFLRKFQVN